MTTYYFFSLLLVTSLASTAQTNQTYQQKDGAEQLIGMTTIGHLETDPLYASWFTQNYQSFKITSKNTSWTDQLVDLQVTIYYGSWCGDSKYYVPRFIKLWDELGLSRSQLKLIALYDGEVPNRYKQGPLQEEKDKYIHRVPTFIFAKNEEELARIVEHPVNDLETDVAQIALGYPSQPSYRGANYLMRAFSSKDMKDLYKEKQLVKQMIRWEVKNMHELNTLGYVLIADNKLEEAAYVFDLNRDLFPYSPITHESYAFILSKSEKYELAVANYQKALLLDPDRENASLQIQLLEEKLSRERTE